MRAVICMLLSVGLLAGCQEEETAPPPPPRPVVVEFVAPQTSRGRDFVGRVTPGTQLNLSFTVSGRLVSLGARVGDLVSDGEVLGALDDSDLASNVDAADAGVIAARSQAETARRASERTAELARRGVAPDSAIEEAARKLSGAEAELTSALSVQAKAQDALGFAQLTAPMDGVITSRYREPGSNLSAGEPVLQLAGLKDREVAIDVYEADISALGKDTIFEIRQRTEDQTVTIGHLDEVDPVANAATRTRRVLLTLESPPDSLRLGALVSVSVADDAGPVLTIPASALRDDGQVWRVDATERQVSLVPVQTEPLPNGRLRVNGGLSEGDEIVIKGINSLTDGQAVGQGMTE